MAATEPQPDPGQQPQPGPLHPAEVEASAWAGPSKDGAGSAVTFEAENLVDGLADTAWRVEGDGVGHTLTFRFGRPVHLTTIGSPSDGVSAAPARRCRQPRSPPDRAPPPTTTILRIRMFLTLTPDGGGPMRTR